MDSSFCSSYMSRYVTELNNTIGKLITEGGGIKKQSKDRKFVFSAEICEEEESNLSRET